MTIENIFEYISFIYIAFLFVYGMYVATEDLKEKMIHAFPITCSIFFYVIFFIAYSCIIKRYDYLLFFIPIIIYLICFQVFEYFNLWGSGDTKMAMQGAVFILIFMRNTNILTYAFSVCLYLLTAHVIGLITCLITKEKRAPMGHAFLIANLFMLFFLLGKV